MNCHHVRERWNPYYDGETDAVERGRIEAHLADCASCAAWYAGQSRLEESLVAKLRQPAPSGAAWRRVTASLDAAHPVRRRRRWPALAASGAAVLLALAVWHGQAPTAPSLSAAAASWHERLSTGSEQVPFRSDSDEEVERFLRGQVGFAVRCPPRRDAGFAVEGAGTGAISQQSTAYLTGRVEQTQVSIFILPRQGLGAFPHQREALQQERIHRCREGRYEMALQFIGENVVVVIGDLPAEHLLRVLQAYGSYHDHPAETAPADQHA